ncbi:MAG: hypothetical protein HFG27_08635, partial [Provencibacterium sp.]|nr:hypothetical protein [Provencibacterium sp.]
INLVKPEGSTSSGKDNPTTGASEIPAALLSCALLSFAALAAKKLFR